MNKKYIIGILVIVLGVVAGFYISNKTATAPTSPDVGQQATTTAPVAIPAPVKSGTHSTAPSVPLMTKSGAYIVSYTNAGFVPAMITIKRGKSVHFVNHSSKAMSIMSVDQASQLYRQLNQEQSVGRGGFYDFSFVNAGIWTYTNRNNRADRGTIIVE